MSPPTYAPTDGNTKAGARSCTRGPNSDARTGGSSCAATTNGAIDSGSGSIPSASWVIVTLPHTEIS